MGCRKSTFSHASYAAFRPSYPPLLYDTILARVQAPRNLCVDLGCGHGVVTRALAASFPRVIGIDPSDGMIRQAEGSTSKEEYPNLTFRRSPAESLPFLENESVDLIVAGQAAHWFDYPKLWPEMRRIVRKGGTLAFWGYQDRSSPRFPVPNLTFHTSRFCRFSKSHQNSEGICLQ